MKKFYFLLVFTLGLFLFGSAQEFQIDDLCDVLPETADIAVDEAKPAGYMSVIVTDGSWLNGSYLGWCIDTDNSIDVAVYDDVDVYCSYETLPDGLVEYPENLDLVNWILNNVAVGQVSACSDNYTFGDIQKAIWMLMDDSPIPLGWLSYIQPYDDCRVTEILTNAGVSGEGYEPGIDDYVGVIFDPGTGIQSVIIPYQITCPEEPEECGECKGGLLSLDLEYLGTEAANVRVYGKKKHGDEEIEYFNAEVQPNGIVHFVGTGPDGKMEKDVYIDYGGDEEIYIHTSCSGDGIYIGQVHGDLFEVTAGISKDGGPLCEGSDEECGDCIGGLTSLSLEYLGDNANNIKVYGKKKHGNDILYFDEAVLNGGIIQFTGTGPHGKMEKDIYIIINDNENKKTEIHTSCSGAGIYVGQVFDDLYEVVAGISKDGGPLCEGSSVDCGDCKGGLTSLSLEYLGVNADNIKVYGKKKHGDDILYFNDAVNNGDTITFTGTGPHGKMEKDIYIVINDNMDDKTKIHTSCSGAGIYIGQVFDGLYEVVAGISKDGGPLCEYIPPPPNWCDTICGDCDGQVSFLELQYQGSESGLVEVWQKNGKHWVVIYSGNHDNGDIFSFAGVAGQNKMGAKIYLYVDDEWDTEVEIHTSCSQDIYAGQTWGDYYIVSGESSDGGPLCEYTPPDEDDCGECKGQITWLDLKYTGASTANIRVYKDKVKPDKLLAEFVGADAIGPGGNFEFEGVGPHKKMGAKIRITIDGDDENYVEIHTSCSQDIYVGSTYNDLYEVLAGTSHEGGPLCVEPDKSSRAGNIGGIEPGLIIYPNPMSNIGTLDFVASENAYTTVEIYNIVGTRVDVLFNDYVESGSKTSMSIDATKYPKGMYLIYIRNGSTIHTEKLSIMN